MENKTLFGLYLSQFYIDENTNVSGSVNSICVCASYDQDLLNHYCKVFNEAEDIRSKLRPVNRVRETYKVMPINLL